jgi:signal peptidase I
MKRPVSTAFPSRGFLEVTTVEQAKKILKEWVIPFGIEILVLLFIIKFLFFFVIVPTGSMIPTIDKASVLFALRVHDPEKLERGDIVVFESDELELTLVKRLVGLPGDHVVITEDGDMILNGEPVEEDYVFYKDSDPDHAGDFQVPEGCYLFMGDNRSGSNDARLWEEPYIPGEKITGKAVFTIWPVGNFGPLH